MFKEWAVVNEDVVSDIMSMLVDNKLVNNPHPYKMSDFVGDYNSLGNVYQEQELDLGLDAGAKDASALPAEGAAAGPAAGALGPDGLPLPPAPWVPPDPSMAQLRSALTEYCVLPLASQGIKSTIGADPKDPKAVKDIKTIMLYGPAGSGKTMMVEAIANELGALLLNVSPARLDGLFTDIAKKPKAPKNAPVRLLHAIYKIAREDPEKLALPTGPELNPHAPVIVYMDECEKFFEKGDKKNKVRLGRWRTT